MNDQPIKSLAHLTASCGHSPEGAESGTAQPEATLMHSTAGEPGQAVVRGLANNTACIIANALFK